MAKRTLRIFISSPGDVGEERVIAGRVVERLAGEFGQSIELDPVLWEHEPLRATSHFQEQIALPSKTDVVVCILWSRLGTRLPEGFTRDDGSTYASGTEWEFEDAARSFREKGTPDLLVYRKTREAVIGLSDEAAILERLRQKKALDAFIERWFGSPEESFKAAFHAFETADDFEGLFESHLRKLIAEQLPEHLTSAEGDAVRVSWHTGSPFRGLEAFDFEHAPVFFGRTRAVGEVKQAVEAQAARGTAFLTVFGMSGSGKSSLVRAGLLPTIAQPGVVERIGLWRWCTLRPSDAIGGLFDGLAQALMGETALPELSALKWDRARLAEQFRSASHLAAQPIEQALAAAAESAELATGAEARLALVVDQMEELFTLERIDEAARAAFIGVLASLAQSGHVWVIGAMRSDFYHRCAEVPELVALSEGAGQYHLVPPSPAEIAQIIRNPARAAGLRFEEAPETGERLDDVLHAAAARDPAALPLLEFTLEELFKRRSDDGVLTFAAYQRLGGLEGALARRAEEVFSDLEGPAQESLPAVLRALVTVETGDDELIAARRVALETVIQTPDRKALVDAFVEARLLVTDKTNDGTAVLRVAHEALLRSWPRINTWIDENRELLRVRERVRAAAQRWETDGRPHDLLLARGKPLEEAQQLLKLFAAELDKEEADFIRASMLKARRAKNIRRAAVALLGVLTVLTTLGFYLANDRLENIRRLSDRISLRESETTASDLWPADTEKIPSLEKWLSNAQQLVARHGLHKETLAELREDALPQSEQDRALGRWKFDQTELQWEHDTLAELVTAQEKFMDPDPTEGTMANVEYRLTFARTVRRRTLEDERDAWEEARASISDPTHSAIYKGLDLPPQEGLVPLGRDPDSGLWEFWHLQTGERPERDKGGRIVPTADMGLVFVLIPGGSFRMGMEHPTKGILAGEVRPPLPEHDYAHVHESDSTGHRVDVKLDAFFLSKYEMTQGQWRSFTGRNPSYWNPDNDVHEDRVYTLRHPVEVISISQSQRMLFELGLTLPTEARWEYAARGGGDTVWWTGDDPRSIAGAANLADRTYSGEGQNQWETWLDDGFPATAPVGSYLPNGFGLYDVMGNVWEMCLDAFDEDAYDLPFAAGDGLRRIQPEDAKIQVIRGGSWHSLAIDARSARREGSDPDSSGSGLGVRPARLIRR